MSPGGLLRWRVLQVEIQLHMELAVDMDQKSPALKGSAVALHIFLHCLGGQTKSYTVRPASLFHMKLFGIWQFGPRNSLTKSLYDTVPDLTLLHVISPFCQFLALLQQVPMAYWRLSSETKHTLLIPPV